MTMTPGTRQSCRRQHTFVIDGPTSTRLQCEGCDGARAKVSLTVTIHWLNEPVEAVAPARG
jgi:hypothetical protein